MIRWLLGLFRGGRSMLLRAHILRDDSPTPAEMEFRQVIQESREARSAVMEDFQEARNHMTWMEKALVPRSGDRRNHPEFP